MKFAAEDSWRGASNNLKVIVPAALSHVCRNSEAVVIVGNEATARQRLQDLFVLGLSVFKIRPTDSSSGVMQSPCRV